MIRYRICHRFLYHYGFQLINSPLQTGDVITFAQFEEGGLTTETLNDAESCDKSDNKSIMMSEKDMENLDEKEKFDDDLINT